MAPGSAFLPRAGHAALVALTLGVAALVDAGCGHGVAASRPVARVARTSGCVARRGLPDPGCTPGAVDARVAPTTLDTTICRRGYTRRVRPPERVTQAIKRERLAAYGEPRARLRNVELDHLLSGTGRRRIAGSPASSMDGMTASAASAGEGYVLDHLVPLELGGSNAPANLWPQPATESHEKDQAENYLRAMVCGHRIPLTNAQREIAADWTAVYRRLGPGTLAAYHR